MERGREKAPAAICRKVLEAKMNGNHEIEIWGDGKHTRSFMYIDDCIKGAPKGVNGRNSDNTRILELMGWEPSIRLKEGMAKTIESQMLWARRNSATFRNPLG